MLIAIEGLDASGKATQAKALSAHLQCRLISFPTYDKEGGALAGPVISEHLQRKWTTIATLPHPAPINDPALDAFVFQSLQTINRYEMAPQIKAVTDYGGHVVLDRYWQSGYAFGGADDLDPIWLLQIHKMLPQPHLNILLDVDYETSLARRPDRRDRYEKMGAAFYDAVREQYLDLWCVQAAAHKLPGRWVVLDGRKSVESIEETISQLVCSAP